MSALLFIALVLGARRVGRELASPFEGFERFARTTKAPVVDPDAEFLGAIQAIDWDESIPAVAENPAVPDALKVLVPTSRETPRLAATLLASAAYTELLATRIAVDVKLYFGVPREPDLESLAASLKLSDSQKARISDLMEWKRWSLESLAGVEQSDEMAKTIEDGYREAVKMELDHAQARDYDKLTAPQGVRLVGEEILDLSQAGDRTVSLSMRRALRALATVKTQDGE
ncbi:MAG TPA: hypothetical protein VJU16_02330 [Planctomycetota bacterium]|nr:hypothetical protein [Planctomycetota bacterium]